MAAATATRRPDDHAPPRPLQWHQLLLLGLLLACLLGSALGVVYSTHSCRQLYARLQVLEASQWYLQEDYGRLLLEQSTWASPHRVEKVAEDELGMEPPMLSRHQVIQP